MGDPGSVSGSGRSPEKGMAYPLHGQRSLAGYNPQGHRELDMTERRTLSLTFYITVVCNQGEDINIGVVLLIKLQFIEIPILLHSFDFLFWILSRPSS